MILTAQNWTTVLIPIIAIDLPYEDEVYHENLNLLFIHWTSKYNFIPFHDLLI